MKTLKLLIVEDDPEQIKAYERDVKSFNLDSLVRIEEKIISNKKDALETLENMDEFFDAAIVDLKLDNGEVEDQEFSGNEVLRKIKGNLRFPVFVVSGTPQHIADDLREQSSLFKIKTRGVEDNHLEQLVKIYDTGITNILGRKGEVEKYLNNIFWKHLSNSMEMWISDKTRDPIQKEKSLLRYTVLHMQEYIDDDIEKYHPSEFYITEPVKANIFTGDIVIFQKERYVILTPSCDIILRGDGTRNAEKILFCRIKNINTVISGTEGLTAATSTNNKTRQKVYKFIQNNSKQNFHFIPKSNTIEAGLIDFQDKLTLCCEEVNKLIGQNKIKRLATVSSPFLKDIISRYSNYYARQGSPDFDSNEIYGMMYN